MVKDRVALEAGAWESLLVEMHRVVYAHYSISSPVLGADSKAQESHRPSAVS